jgi:hypothetical protein
MQRVSFVVHIGPRAAHASVGTVLGKPTYAELQDLVNAQRAQLAQLDAAKACPPWAAADPTGYGAWAASLFDATAKLTAELDSAQGGINIVPVGARALVPVIAPIGMRTAWERVLDAAKPFHTIRAAFDKAGYCPWPSAPPLPQPTATDIDLNVFNWAGKALSFTTGLGNVALVVGAYLVLKELKW